MNQYELRIGFWNAVCVSILIVLIDIGMILSTIFFPLESIPNIESYANNFNCLQMLPLIPSLFFVPFYIVLMLSIKNYGIEDKKTLGQLSYSFSLLSATILSVHYYIQLTIVRQGLLDKDLTYLWLFSAPNPHSLFWVLSALGYGMMGISLLTAAPIFSNSSERVIKWLLIINGINGIIFLFGNMLNLFVINILSSFIWGIFFLVVVVLISKRFRYLMTNKKD